MPQLNVRNISDGEIFPVLESQEKTTGRSQVFAYRSTPRPSGKIRGIFSVNPPPVIWAKALTAPVLMASKQLLTYTLFPCNRDPVQGKPRAKYTQLDFTLIFTSQGLQK